MFMGYQCCFAERMVSRTGLPIPNVVHVHSEYSSALVSRRMLAAGFCHYTPHHCVLLGKLCALIDLPFGQSLDASLRDSREKFTRIIQSGC